MRSVQCLWETDSYKSLTFSESQLKYIHVDMHCICIYTYKICLNKKDWLGKLAALDMTLMGWLGRVSYYDTRNAICWSRISIFGNRNPILTFKLRPNILIWHSKSYFDIQTEAEYRILTFKILFGHSHWSRISYFDIRNAILTSN